MNSFIYSNTPPNKRENLLKKEWLLTNGLGGYSSGTILGANTRRYHALLTAALPSPLGRTIMLNQVIEEITLVDGSVHRLTPQEEIEAKVDSFSAIYLKTFYLDEDLPVWIFEIKGIQIEKRVLLIHSQNTVHISYKLLTPGNHIKLKLIPLLHFRSHEAAVDSTEDFSYTTTQNHDGYEIITKDFPSLKLKINASKAEFYLENREWPNLFYRIESERGYASIGKLWSPGYMEVEVDHNYSCTLIASTESWQIANVLSFDEALDAEKERRYRLLGLVSTFALDEFAQKLVVAADQFIITPVNRIKDKVVAKASGNEVRTIIAGYHWFTDWGRDTMIAFEGLMLCTKRYQEAKWILRAFHNYIKDGLIPNMFPEGQNDGLYHTADATFWYFHAVVRYVEVTGDRDILKHILPDLVSIIKHHLKGTKFGIAVDPHDGLLKQGAEGYQLTWMDAKVDDWVVTPRRGKAVEINSLWYNALRLMEEWVKLEINEAHALPYRTAAKQAYVSFNQRFWFKEGGYLYDVIDGERGLDTACRPNQLFAFSLKYAVLDPKQWQQVLDVVKSQLLTPYGLRSLAPNHENFHKKYEGNLWNRDAAYHQGTVWSWLIGPFIDAWLKVYPDKKQEAHLYLEGFKQHIQEYGTGSIAEIFDATEPFEARGCIAQAWSVAEVLRCWLKTR